MSSGRSAKLALTISINPSGSTVLFEAQNGTTLTVDGDLSSENLVKERERLETDLESFRAQCSEFTTPIVWNTTTEATQLLHRRGRRLAFHLFGKSSNIIRVERFVRDHVQVLQASGFN